MDLKIGDALKHLKRGTEYRVLGIGPVDLPPEMLTDEAEIVPGAGDVLCELGAEPGRPVGVQSEGEVSEKTQWVLYVATVRGDGDVPDFWLRPSAEFSGRFIRL